MIKSMRAILVALLVVMLTISPATACHYCGGGFGGGYHYGGGYGGYYTGCGSSSYSDGGCCGGEVVMSDDCGGCDSGCTGCSDCGDCGGGCSDCGMNDGCDCEGDAMTTEAAPETAPEPPTSKSSTVNRVPTEPAPALPTYQAPLPPVETAPVQTTPITPPVEPTAEPLVPATEPVSPPATETPTVEPVTPPPTETTTPPATTEDDLFGAPSTEETPLPAEEPATPSETEDFFSESTTETTTEAPPATEPATESAAPSDDDLFGPPADDEKPVEEEKPAEETSDDDLFGNAEAVLGLPGGLSSSENRHWVDNTGNFTCDGRMLRFVDGKVQILKVTGRTTTVPLARLSKGDLEFVNRQATAQQAETLSKTARVSSAR